MISESTGSNAIFIQTLKQFGEHGFSVSILPLGDVEVRKGPWNYLHTIEYNSLYLGDDMATLLTKVLIQYHKDNN